jgi:methionyl-tRNA formyltransferase
MTSNSRVVVFGYDQLVLSSLDVVTMSGDEVVAVVFPSSRTDPRVAQVRKIVEGRGHTVLLQPPRAESDSLAEQIRDLQADVGLVWSYPMILPPAVFTAPRLGCVNLHPAPLPRYRGTDVLQWMLIEGASEAGVTLHYLDEGTDTGPIIAHSRRPVEAEDDLLSLMRKFKEDGEELLRQWWPSVSDGSAIGEPQDEASAAYYGSLSESDRRVDWTSSNVEVSNQVRGLVAPDLGAWTLLGGQRVVIRACLPIPEPPNESGNPGVVTGLDASGMLVATGQGHVRILKVEVPRTATTPADFGFSVGDCFGP